MPNSNLSFSCTSYLLTKLIISRTNVWAGTWVRKTPFGLRCWNESFSLKINFYTDALIRETFNLGIHLLPQVSPNSTVSSSLSIRVMKVSSLPWRPRVLLRWILQRHATVSSLTHAVRANHVYLHLGEGKNTHTSFYLNCLEISVCFISSSFPFRRDSRCQHAEWVPPVVSVSVPKLSGLRAAGAGGSRLCPVRPARGGGGAHHPPLVLRIRPVRVSQALDVSEWNISNWDEKWKLSASGSQRLTNRDSRVNLNISLSTLHEHVHKVMCLFNIKILHEKFKKFLLVIFKLVKFKKKY